MVVSTAPVPVLLPPQPNERTDTIPSITPIVRARISPPAPIAGALASPAPQRKCNGEDGGKHLGGESPRHDDLLRNGGIPSLAIGCLGSPPV